MAANMDTNSTTKHAIHEGFLNMRSKGYTLWQLQYYVLYDDCSMDCFDDSNMLHKKESLRVAAVESIESLEDKSKQQLQPRPLLPRSTVQLAATQQSQPANADDLQLLHTSLSSDTTFRASSLEPMRSTTSESLFSTSGASSISASAGHAYWDQTPRVSRTSTGASSHNNAATDKPFTFVLVDDSGACQWIVSALSKQDFTKWLHVLQTVTTDKRPKHTTLTTTTTTTTSARVLPPPISIQFDEQKQIQTLSLSLSHGGASEHETPPSLRTPKLVRNRPGAGPGLDDTILTDIHSIVDHVLHAPQKQGDNESSSQSHTHSTQQQQQSGDSSKGKQTGGGQTSTGNQGLAFSNGGGGGAGNGGRRRPSDDDRKHNDNKQIIFDEANEDEEEEDEKERDDDDDDAAANEDSKSDDKSLNKSKSSPAGSSSLVGRVYAHNNGKKKKASSSLLYHPQSADSLYEPHDSLLRGQGMIIISKQLTSKILPSRVRLTNNANMFYFMDKWTAIQCYHQHIVCHDPVLVLNYDFRDATSNDFLYCVARKIDPSANRNFSYRMDDRLYTAVELAQSGFSVPLSSRLNNAMFVHLEQNLAHARRAFLYNLAHLIQYTEWHKLRVYDCNSNKRRITLSMTKLELRHTLQTFARNESKRVAGAVIPVVMFAGVSYKISYVWMVAIDEQYGVPSFIGIGFDYDAEHRVNITALHLDIRKLQQQHQLIHPEHECQCFEGCDTSMITDLVIGNPTELTKAMRSNRDVQSMQQTIHNLLGSKNRTIQELQERCQQLQARVYAQTMHNGGGCGVNAFAANYKPVPITSLPMTSAPMVVFAPNVATASSMTMMNVAPSTSVPTSALQPPFNMSNPHLQAMHVPVHSLSASNITALLNLSLWPPPPCPQSLGINNNQ
eukprot:CAMPEP_0202695910 /NCGR_PEP_ID=MMETSP1385-20130828/9340_1 /ASSEMBLY_ACC=CAM_ASM_000861 /TAXON_ID=933848 /ORGANISM="Elphidium margaritaceum" /LENGTH=896 /DNA_ID=CAMNT_0049351991 /DNA_START=13 /DNA_END=2703 /DNA_ORIENTATION=+